MTTLGILAGLFFVGLALWTFWDARGGDLRRSEVLTGVMHGMLGALMILANVFPRHPFPLWVPGVFLLLFVGVVVAKFRAHRQERLDAVLDR